MILQALEQFPDLGVDDFRNACALLLHSLSLSKEIGKENVILHNDSSWIEDGGLGAVTAVDEMLAVKLENLENLKV